MGQPVSNPESRFLTEIPGHLLTGGAPSLDARRRVITPRAPSASGSGGGFGSDRQRGRESFGAPTRGRNSTVHYDIGDRMNHPKYGLGKAVAKEGAGPTERIVFDFGGSIGRMTFMTLGGLPGEKL